MTQGTQKTDDRTDSRNADYPEWRFSEQTSYNQLNGKVWLIAVVLLSAKNAVTKLGL